jgi:hypothetical protein
MRLLEKGLHGGLGVGNVGVCIAGHGIGKTSFVVGVAVDELLREGTVLHVALDQTLAHVRNYYDTVYEALASNTHLDDAVTIHSEIDENRRIHAYRSGQFSASKLADTVKVETEAGMRPSLIVVDGLEFSQLTPDEIGGVGALAEELAAEVWLSVHAQGTEIAGLPDSLGDTERLVSVILTLESRGEEITLRALKDHENEDLQNLHVGLDPRTLLLIRS